VEKNFPRQKLLKGTGNGQRVVVVACGSFSPITYLHLRLFESARDYCNSNKINLIGGYLSPCNDSYKKKGLASGTDRISMCQLATESNEWVMVDDWEVRQKTFQTTIVVLEHLYNSLNHDIPNKQDHIQVKLLCGADLLESFNSPGVWATEDIKEIVSKFGLMVLERVGSDASTTIYQSDILFQHQNNIAIMKQYIPNEMSSTKIRLSVKRGLSINYLTPEPVVKYIRDKKLYKE